MNKWDMLHARLEARGNKIAALRAAGICSHGWLQGPPGATVPTCLDCGVTFATMEDAYAAGNAAMALPVPRPLT